MAKCQVCGREPSNPAAKFCGDCGEPLPAGYIGPPPKSAWKSVPVLIRFAIWLIIIPVLLGFGSCVLLWLATLSHR
jgi:hypothetical protein